MKITKAKYTGWRDRRRPLHHEHHQLSKMVSARCQSRARTARWLKEKFEELAETLAHMTSELEKEGVIKCAEKWRKND